MKNFDSRTYSINDFIEWDDRGQLEISPKFQRRSVWSPQAKSYLIDTILKDKPLPKIFIRATTDPKTKKTTREIVDGQQRIRTILSFVKDGFKISKVHNEEFGGMLYSELPEEVQGEFLKYEVAVDLLLDVQDRDILDVFARLNTYSVSLNKQELFNAKYFGYFKQLVYKLSGDFYTFWTENRIFTDTKIMRMSEAELMTDLIIAALEGIQSKKSADKFYSKYDEVFENRKEIEANIKATMDLIGNLFGATLKTSNFRTVPNFYGLFVALYHMNFGIPNMELPRKAITEKDIPKIINTLEDINSIFELDEIPKEYFEFIKSTKDATTDVPARKTRCSFIIAKLYECMKD
ncbi:MAG: DUF262 domain-containing protein [Firmicutes bacterium]|nr:DUF262 domain-containing protein [Bacillota bacterium]